MKTQAQQGPTESCLSGWQGSHGGAQSGGVVIFKVGLGDADLVTAADETMPSSERVRSAWAGASPATLPTWPILQDGSYSTCGGSGAEQLFVPPALERDPPRRQDHLREEPPDWREEAKGLGSNPPP